MDVFRGGNAFTWSTDSKTLLYTAGQGVHDVLIEHNLDNDQAKVIAQDIAGIASFSSDLNSAVFLQTYPEHNPEVVLLRGDKLRKMTPFTRFVDTAQFESRVVNWKSQDGTPVEGMLWLPIEYRAGQKVPLLTELHGGPTGVTLASFPRPRTYPTQLFLQSGIAVFSPNFRGSVNYGAAFRKKNALSQGIGDYQDVMTGIDYLIAQGIADPERLGIMGWSYGGYLTASVVTQTSRFKAASIGAPATDWFTYYGQTDGPTEVLATYFGGTPWQAADEYSRHSPRSRLKDIRTPCLLQVGSLDINHNGEIYRALTDNGVEVQYVVYPREGHGISEPAHVTDLMERNFEWFRRHLLAAKPKG